MNNQLLHYDVTRSFAASLRIWKKWNLVNMTLIGMSLGFMISGIIIQILTAHIPMFQIIKLVSQYITILLYAAMQIYWNIQLKKLSYIYQFSRELRQLLQVEHFILTVDELIRHWENHNLGFKEQLSMQSNFTYYTYSKNGFWIIILLALTGVIYFNGYNMQSLLDIHWCITCSMFIFWNSMLLDINMLIIHVIIKLYNMATRKYRRRKCVKRYYDGLVEEKECAICKIEYVKGEKLYFLDCNPLHFFHQNCIIEWSNYQNTCPFCREVFMIIN